MDKPIILYRSILTATNVTASSTLSGSAAHLCDLRTFTIWQGSGAATHTLTIDAGTATACDCLGIAGHNLGTLAATVKLESSTDNATWTQRLAAAAPATDNPVMRTFTSASARYWRVTIVNASGNPSIGVVMIGPRLTFDRHPAGNTSLTPVTRQTVVDSATSKGGHLLGSVARYYPYQGSIRFVSLSYSWCTGSLTTFWRDHGRLLMPFFFAVSLDTLAGDVFFCRLPSSGKIAFPQARGDVAEYVDTLDFAFEGIE